MLTALGIIFGVGAVIGMLAIGAGARDESLRFIEQLGVRNLLIESRPATSDQELQQRRRSSPGLTERDVRILAANVDSLELISAAPQHASGASASEVHRGNAGAVRRAARLTRRFTTGISRRAVSSTQQATTRPAPRMCVLGEQAKVALLGYGPAVNKFVKVNDTWLRVVGRTEAAGEFGLRDGAVAGSESGDLYSVEHVSVPVLRQTAAVSRTTWTESTSG